MTSSPSAAALVCSAKGCRARPEHAVVWRNPRLHAPDRRKIWLACEDHRDHLRDFVQLRGFLLEVVPVSELPAGPSGPESSRGAP